MQENGTAIFEHAQREWDFLVDKSRQMTAVQEDEVESFVRVTKVLDRIRTHKLHEIRTPVVCDQLAWRAREPETLPGAVELVVDVFDIDRGQEARRCRVFLPIPGERGGQISSGRRASDGFEVNGDGFLDILTVPAGHRYGHGNPTPPTDAQH